MSLTVLGRASLLALFVLLPAAPAVAADAADHGSLGRYHRSRPMGMLPPEVRYRDPRPVPPRRVWRSAGPPAALIQAYLPRFTERPMYNEPPNRFPQR